MIAHLWALKTQKDLRMRLEYKKVLTLNMMELGLDGETAYDLFKFMDRVMLLPEEVEREYLNEILEYQEKMNMPILAPFEKIFNTDFRGRFNHQNYTKKLRGNSRF